jgi:hypothetical protein
MFDRALQNAFTRQVEITKALIEVSHEIRDLLSTAGVETCPSTQIDDAYRPSKLTTLILQKIAEHPDGIATRDITIWLSSISDPRFFAKSHSQLAQTVSDTVFRLKKSGLIQHKLKDGYSRQGKWYPCLESEATAH